MILEICICEFWPKLCFANASYLNLGRLEVKSRDSQLESTKTKRMWRPTHIYLHGSHLGAECRQASNSPELSKLMSETTSFLRFLAIFREYDTSLCSGLRLAAGGCRLQASISLPPTLACVAIFRSVNRPWNQLKSHNHKLINSSKVGRGPQRSANHTVTAFGMIAHSTMVSVNERPVSW
jgi:hypothetical protein